MSLPTIQVLVGFQTVIGSGDPLQLDNTTFGLLDTGTLSGVTFADLTSISQSITTSRGRSRQLDQFNAGSASVSFDNTSRLLDPLNVDSIYYPFVLPRCPIIIKANGITIFSGVVTDWNLDFDISGNDIMVAQCSDFFTIFANQALNVVTPPAESSSARINRILNSPEIAYEGRRSIGTGVSTLGAFEIGQDTNCLNYLQQVTTSEQGFLFIAADGTVTFRGRWSVLNPVADANFTDDGTGIPYMALSNQFGDELLHNYIVAQSPDAGDEQIATDATSISIYQNQQLSITNLLNSTETEVADLANFLLNKFANPILRFDGLSTQLLKLSKADQNIYIGLDLVDVCSVSKSFAVGSPSLVRQTLIVSGVNHTISPSSHVISLTFESTDGNQYLFLDDPVFGVLGGGGIVYDQVEISYDEAGWVYNDTSADDTAGRLGW
jgi:hypothetical protein